MNNKSLAILVLLLFVSVWINLFFIMGWKNSEVKNTTKNDNEVTNNLDTDNANNSEQDFVIEIENPEKDKILLESWTWSFEKNVDGEYYVKDDPQSDLDSNTSLSMFYNSYLWKKDLIEDDSIEFYNVIRWYVMWDSNVIKSAKEFVKCMSWDLDSSEVSSVILSNICNWENKLYDWDTNPGYEKQYLKLLKEAKWNPSFDCSSVTRINHERPEDLKNSVYTNSYFSCKVVSDSSYNLVEEHSNYVEAVSINKCSEKLDDETLVSLCNDRVKIDASK